MATKQSSTLQRGDRTWRRRWIGATGSILSCVALLITGIAGREYRRQPSSEARLRVSLNPWPGYAFLYLAEEKGFFRQEALDVRLLEFDSLADARRVFEQGQADVLCCTMVELLMMNEGRNAVPVDAFSVADYSNGGDMLLARDTVDSVVRLKGRRIGLEPESLDGLCVYLALKSANLTLDDVTIVPLAQIEMIEALESGLVDAVQVYPPASDQILRLEGMRVLWDSSHVPETIVDVLTARQTLLSERPREVRALLRAYGRAQAYYARHPEESLTILARRCGLSVEALRRSFEKIYLLKPGDQVAALTGGMLRKATRTTADGLIAIGMLEAIPTKTPVDAGVHQDIP